MKLLSIDDDLVCIRKRTRNISNLAKILMLFQFAMTTSLPLYKLGIIASLYKRNLTSIYYMSSSKLSNYAVMELDIVPLIFRNMK